MPGSLDTFTVCAQGRKGNLRQIAYMNLPDWGLIRFDANSTWFCCRHRSTTNGEKGGFKAGVSHQW